MSVVSCVSCPACSFPHHRAPPPPPCPHPYNFTPPAPPAPWPKCPTASLSSPPTPPSTSPFKSIPSAAAGAPSLTSSRHIAQHPLPVRSCPVAFCTHVHEDHVAGIRCSISQCSENISMLHIPSLTSRQRIQGHNILLPCHAPPSHHEIPCDMPRDDRCARTECATFDIDGHMRQLRDMHTDRRKSLPGCRHVARKVRC